MANLTFKRKKELGIAYKNEITIIIDDNLKVDLNQNETKTITLPDGNHKFRFVYYNSVKMPIMGNVEFKIDETHQLSIIDGTTLNVSNSNGMLSVKQNDEKIKTNNSLGKMMDDLKFGSFSLKDIYKFTCIICLLACPLFLGAIVGSITYSIQLALITLFNGIFLITIPVLYNLLKKEALSRENIGYYIVSLIALVFISVVESLSYSIYFAIISCLVSFAVMVLYVNKIVHIKKILLTGLIVTLPISFLIQNLSDGNSSYEEKCAVCDGAGMVNNGFLDFDTCPTCKGTGIPPI